MSEPDSPTFSAERVYQFISDPDHKENLSGRVRAACLTCRRKKIKCSGELNCRTCREKGIPCEGLPQRKKPSRDSGCLSALGHAPKGKVDRKKRLSRSGLRRPNTLAKLGASTDSHDSGYTSTVCDRVGKSMSFDASTLTNDFNKDYSFSVSVRTRDRQSPKPSLHIDTWQLNSSTAESKQEPSYDDTDLQCLSAISPGTQAQAMSADLETNPLDWLSVPEGNNTWWLDQISAKPPSLVAAAQALEEQAQSLRLLAKRQANEEMPDAIRRQTVAFPLPSPDKFPCRYDMLQNQHGVFDDMAMLLARTPGTGSGMTPSLTEFSSWWDVNALDLLSHDQNIKSIAPLERQRRSLQDLSSTSASANMSHLVTSTDDYFGTLWSE